MELKNIAAMNNLVWPEKNKKNIQEEPAVRAAVKTELSYRNDTKTAIFVAANKNIDNAKVELAYSKS